MNISINEKEVEATSISISAKCSDLFSANLKNNKRSTVAEYQGYVPKFFPTQHCGDYVCLDIDLATGKILNWKSPTQADLESVEWEKEED